MYTDMAWFRSSFGDVELTDERMRHILEFHPDVDVYRDRFQDVLSGPDYDRRSTSDTHVRVFYKRLRGDKHLAIVVKTNERNFILTAYLTDKPKHEQKR
jgi:hypothetical protein